MAWVFSWLRSWDEIWGPEHLGAWLSAARAPGGTSPFMHPDLVRAWLATQGGEARLLPFFLVARRSDGARAWWLLVQPRTSPAAGLIRHLRPVGEGTGGPHFAYSDPILLPGVSGATASDFWPAALQEVSRHASSWFDVLTLPRMRESVVGQGSGLTLREGAPFVRLDVYPDFAAYMAARPNGLLHQIERKQRKLAAGEGYVFREYGSDEVADVLAWLPDLVAAQQARYPGSAIAPGLLENIVRAGMPGGLVRASVLRIGDRVASWRLDYDLAGTLYLAFCAINSAFGRASPGALHAYHALEAHMGRGGRRYDLLIGAQAYKYDWTDGEEQRLCRIEITGRNPATFVRRHAARGVKHLQRAFGGAFGAAVGVQRDHIQP